MVTVAVTGVATAVGHALLEQLDADRSVTRIVGLGAVPPRMPVAKLTFRPSDLRDPRLVDVIAGADVVVHLASEAEAYDDTSLDSRAQTTRRLLEAVARADVRKLIYLSTGTVYGAHPDNPLPLDERMPLRAHHDFLFAYRHVLAEELVNDFAAAHPAVVTTVLRPAPVLGVGVDSVVTRHLEKVRLPLVAGYDPCAQFVDVDDLAAALRLAVDEDLRGPYNVAADGWLTAAEVAALLDRKLLHLPEELAFWSARQLWRWRVVEAPPGALPYLMYPWVLDTSRLQEAGWNARWSNREILRQFAATHAATVGPGRLRLRRRHVHAAAVGGAVAVTGALSWALRQRLVRRC